MRFVTANTSHDLGLFFSMASSTNSFLAGYHFAGWTKLLIQYCPKRGRRDPYCLAQSFVYLPKSMTSPPIASLFNQCTQDQALADKFVVHDSDRSDRISFPINNLLEHRRGCSNVAVVHENPSNVFILRGVCYRGP